jgi:hypothetical protein
MTEVYNMLNKVSGLLSLEQAAKLALGTTTELDMTHILVAIEQHDQCKGWRFPK